MEKAVQEWLGRIARSEKPPPSVVAWNVGLFETADGFAAYLCGADRYSAADPDWACDESFTPAERTLPLPAAGGWKDVEADVARAAKAFLASDEGKRSFFAGAQAVAVGFDDGDLVRVA